MKDSCNSMTTAWARAVMDSDFRHSLAICPVFLQNRQRLLSMQH